MREPAIVLRKRLARSRPAPATGHRGGRRLRQAFALSLAGHLIGLLWIGLAPPRHSAGAGANALRVQLVPAPPVADPAPAPSAPVAPDPERPRALRPSVDPDRDSRPRPVAGAPRRSGQGSDRGAAGAAQAVHAQRAEPAALAGASGASSARALRPHPDRTAIALASPEGIDSPEIYRIALLLGMQPSLGSLGRAAGRAAGECRLRLEFEHGAIGSAAALQSSGSEVADRAAIALALRVAQTMPVPASLAAARFSVEIEIRFASGDTGPPDRE